jgi:hypothetical protein
MQYGRLIFYLNGCIRKFRQLIGEFFISENISGTWHRLPCSLLWFPEVQPIPMSL